MKKKPLTFILIGRSGCGKGTQAKLLKKYLEQKYGKHSVLYVYVGDELRKLAKGKTLTAKLVKQTMNQGKLMPQFIASWAWGQSVVNKLDEKKYLIFDGSPRQKMEAEIMDEAVGFYGRKIIPILINISEKEAIKRMLKRKRPDDTKEKIKNRLNWFKTEVEPTIKYYRKRIVKINGEQSVEEVYKDLLRAIK
jgi:adenylate kinase